MNVQHSSRHDKWYTPLDIIESVRFVLAGESGPIDFDPCSDEFGNSRVKARWYENEDGTDWYYWPQKVTRRVSPLLPDTERGISVFVNPPGGKTKNRSSPVLFWEALLDFRSRGSLSHAVFLAFSIEQLQTTQQCAESMLDFPICIPRKRIKFDTSGPTLPRSPSHSNAIVYVPGSCDNTLEFVKEFSKYGKVKV